jgi:hypothetical protein
MGKKRDARIEAGIEYLANLFSGDGGDHLDKIDINELDLNDPSNCVLSQIFGFGYYQVMRILNLTHDEATDMGFNPDSDTSDGDECRNYPNKLTKAWVKTLQDIRG